MTQTRLYIERERRITAAAFQPMLVYVLCPISNGGMGGFFTPTIIFVIILIMDNYRVPNHIDFLALGVTLFQDQTDVYG